MKFVKWRQRVQGFVFGFVIINMILYGLYTRGLFAYKGLSIGDMNPYGGWSALKSMVVDMNYHFTGISFGMALTIGISVTAFAVGKVFCGAVCPIGTLQDLLYGIGRVLSLKVLKLHKGKLLWLEIIKYIVLFLGLAMSVLGLGHYLSPLSPWLSFLNIMRGAALEIGAGILLLIIVSSLFGKRFFCRFLCPLGAWQSLLYGVGLSGIKRLNKCKACVKCFEDCPMGIQNDTHQEISPECIHCLSCIEKDCIQGTSGYKIYLFNQRVSSTLFLTLGLMLLVSFYIGLPLLKMPDQRGLPVEALSLKEGIYQGQGKGFGGMIVVEIEIKEQKIISIQVKSHRESSGYFEEVFMQLTKHYLETQQLAVDGISGATVTSRGFSNAVRNAISQGISEE